MNPPRRGFRGADLGETTDLLLINLNPPWLNSLMAGWFYLNRSALALFSQVNRSYILSINPKMCYIYLDTVGLTPIFLERPVGRFLVSGE